MQAWTGEKIRVLRLRLGWSQAELARRLGCRQQTVSEWETNLHEPQNAYSKLLDHLLTSVERYNYQMNHLPHAESAMKNMGLSQITIEEAVSSFGIIED